MDQPEKMPAPEKMVAEFQKNLREVIRVTLKTWNNRRLLDLRTFYPQDGVMKPGRKGLTIQAHQIPALCAALEAAEKEARAEGLPTTSSPPQIAQERKQ